MGFGPREFRPLTRHPKNKNCFYLGQWRIDENVTEGRGVIFNHKGFIYKGYVKNNQIIGYGQSYWTDDSRINSARNHHSY